MATQFIVKGPYEVGVHKGKASRTLTEENVKEFWNRHPELARLRGCYVFAIRAGRGGTPGYVGKATRTFKQEVFQPHKLAKYQRFLADYVKGTPVLFFIEAPRRKGKANSNHIQEAERFLIQVALAANPDLLNIKGTKEEQWSISGVLRPGQGKPSAAAKALKRTLKI